MIRDQCIPYLADGEDDFNLLVERVLNRVPKDHDFPIRGALFHKFVPVDEHGRRLSRRQMRRHQAEILISDELESLRTAWWLYHWPLDPLELPSEPLYTKEPFRAPEPNTFAAALSGLAHVLAGGDEDLRQDLLEEVWRKRDRYRGLAPFVNWAWPVMRHRSLRLRRRSKGVPEVLVSAPVEESFREVDMEMRLDVGRAVSALPLGQKKVIVALLLGMPLARSGLSNPTVYMERAILRLRPRLAEYDPVQGRSG